MPDDRLVRAGEGHGRLVRRRAFPTRRAGARSSCTSSRRATLDNSATLQSALGQLFYLNLPQRALHEGPLIEVPLRRRALTPVNGRTYSLSLGDDALHADRRQRPQGARGRALRDRARRPSKYEYLLDGFGWDSEIQYAGDIDGDGLPDFVVYVNGNNAGTWYVLLSSEAKPGMNAPSATAHRQSAAETQRRMNGERRWWRTFRPRERCRHATG